MWATGCRHGMSSGWQSARPPRASTRFQEIIGVRDIYAEQNPLRVCPAWVSAFAGLGSWRTSRGPLPGLPWQAFLVPQPPGWGWGAGGLAGFPAIERSSAEPGLTVAARGTTRALLIR